MILIVVGVCGLYTYRILLNVFINTKKTINHTEQMSGEAVNYQTASPEQLRKTDIGWERIKYVHLPELKKLTWTSVNESCSIDGVEYTVLDAKIKKEWNSKWNYDVIKDDFSFNNKKQLKGDKSFLSVTLKIKNTNEKAHECYVNSAVLHVYDKEGEKIGSGEMETASMDKPYTKSFYRILLKKEEVFKVEMVYVVNKKMISDNYYYFIEVDPYSVCPPLEGMIGIFKLPLGIEREMHEDNKK